MTYRGPNLTCFGPWSKKPHLPTGTSRLLFHRYPTSTHMSRNPDVVIVGAGPYGLSIAAHLRFHGVNVRIIGAPLSLWRDHMPEGMFLKSDGFASNLSDPQSHFTLKHYCSQAGIPYHDLEIPVRLSTFLDYGDAFQQANVPNLENDEVSAVTQESSGFRVQLRTGEQIPTPRVVIATGISNFSYTPPVLERLASDRISHSFAHGNVDRFRAKDVVIVGGGASAMDLAALLQERGARVRVLVRAETVRFIEPRDSAGRSVMQRLRHPDSGVGPSLQGWFYSNYPQVFFRFPREVRLGIVRRFLGPAAGWTVKDRVLGKIPIVTGAHIARAAERNGCVYLEISRGDRGLEEIAAEHVISNGLPGQLEALAISQRRHSLSAPYVRRFARALRQFPILGFRSVFRRACRGK